MNPVLLTSQLPSLRRYARALTGNTWAADDLVQDTLERACDKWRLWAPGSDLRAWLFTLMHNLYLNQQRPQANAPHAAVDVDDMQEELHAPPAGADTRIDLQRCLLLLPADQRAVLLLVTLEDMAYEDVARILNIPIGTVMSRLSRARARLRELMDGKTTNNIANTDASNAAVSVPAQAAPYLRRLK
jgi:RNA polymerase sigma-70 factor (ECF subfamily)